MTSKEGGHKNKRKQISVKNISRIPAYPDETICFISGGFSVIFIHPSNTQLQNKIRESRLLMSPAASFCLEQCMILKMKTNTLDTDQAVP